MLESLKFAKNHTKITKVEEQTILHARKSFLFHKKDVWTKKQGGLFDVTMGAFDGAEVCELIGTFILHQLAKKYNKSDIGLYRDDGLAVFKNCSGPQMERIKKYIQETFKEHQLDIIIQCNQRVTDFLDVTLDLQAGTHKPYRKPDDNTMYIHKESNHPPNILKDLPISIERRISNLSSSKEIFDQSIPHYQNAINQSGYNHTLKYTPPEPEACRTKRKRRRNITWFNPPFNRAVQTPIAKRFLTLLDKHFPPTHKLHRIFNRNYVRVSYACTKNMKGIIDAHNKKIVNENVPNPTGRSCNCTNRATCPLNQNCLTSNIVYEAEIRADVANYKPKIYIGLCETTFKKRYANHKTSFTNQSHENATELSKEFWSIRKKYSVTPLISWRVIKKCAFLTSSSKSCSLCLSEKTAIVTYKGNNLLNKRSEIVSKCRHETKFLLHRFDSKD